MNSSKSLDSIVPCSLHKCKCFFSKGGIFLSRKEMLEYIRERLPEADDFTLEQIYDFLQEVEY